MDVNKNLYKDAFLRMRGHNGWIDSNHIFANLASSLRTCSTMVAVTSPLHRAAEHPFCVCQLLGLHFCQLLSNFTIDLELEYIIGKPMKRRFQRYIVRTEILSTFHARVEYLSVTKYATETIGPMGTNNPKIHPSLESRQPPSNT